MACWAVPLKRTNDKCLDQRGLQRPVGIALLCQAALMNDEEHLSVRPLPLHFFNYKPVLLPQVGFEMALSETTLGVEAYLKATFAATLRIDIFENPLVRLTCLVCGLGWSKVRAPLRCVLCVLVRPSRP